MDPDVAVMEAKVPSDRTGTTGMFLAKRPRDPRSESPSLPSTVMCSSGLLPVASARAS